jgi:hypothetical protein
MITTNTDKELKITLDNTLDMPSYQANVVSRAILEEMGLLYRPEIGGIFYNGKHVCSVIRGGKHHILEEASSYQMEIIIATTREVSTPVIRPENFNAFSQAPAAARGLS